MKTISRAVRIMGHVQGVAYRAWTQSRATREGLTGWVRNEGDGSVSAVFCGPEDRVEAMITACHEGPGAAQVRDVQVSKAEPPGLDGFEIRR